MARRNVTPYRVCPLSLQDHPKWWSLSHDARCTMLFLAMDKHLSSPISGVAVGVELGMLAAALALDDIPRVKNALVELEEVGLLLVDWQIKAVFCPLYFRDTPPPKTIRTVKSWQSTWSRLPDCALKEEIRGEIEAVLEHKVRLLQLFRSFEHPVEVEKRRRGRPRKVVTADEKIEKNAGENAAKNGRKSEKIDRSFGPIFDKNRVEISSDFSPVGDHLSGFSEKSTSGLPDQVCTKPFAANDSNGLASNEASKNPIKICDEISTQNREQGTENKREEIQIGESHDSPLARASSAPDFSTMAGPQTAALSAVEQASGPSRVEATGLVSQPKAASATQCDFSRRPAATMPPPTQTALAWPGGKAAPSSQKAEPKKSSRILRHPELCRRVLDVLNEGRQKIHPHRRLPGIHPTLEHELKTLDDRLDELASVHGTEFAFEFIGELIWARAWNIGIAPSDPAQLEKWREDFGYFNERSPFTGPSKTGPGGWSSSCTTHRNWLEAGKPEPTVKKPANEPGRKDDIRIGALRPAYDPNDYVNVGRDQQAHTEAMMREYREICKAEGIDPDA